MENLLIIVIIPFYITYELYAYNFTWVLKRKQRISIIVRIEDNQLLRKKNKTKRKRLKLN